MPFYSPFRSEYSLTGGLILNIRQLRNLAILLLLVLMNTACSTGYYDGMRVQDRNSKITMSGYITQPGSSGADVRVSALNTLTNKWDLIAHTSYGGTISNGVSWTMNDGTKLYSWSNGKHSLPLKYWKTGTGGHFARVRAEWYNSSGKKVVNLYNTRADWLACFFEDVNGKKNTLGYILPNCFSHRNESYIYTKNHREGSIFCPAPATGLSKKNGHYMLNQLPWCANSIVSKRMREKVSRALIDDHYEINHGSSANAHSVAPVTIGSSTWETGGFFGGHENYIRKMERHVMVYDYPWMPKGKIPSWNPNTTVPFVFRSAVASPNGNCESTSPGCNGWLSGNIANASPAIATPASVQPATVCGLVTPSALHGQVNGWHGGVHITVGNSFASFDSPSFPLFFLWHNYVEDIWKDWKKCGHPIPA